MTRKTANAAFIHHARQQADALLFYFFDASAEALKAQDPSFDRDMMKAEKLVNDLSVRGSVRSKSSPTFLFLEHHPSFTAESGVIAAIEELFPGGDTTLGFYAGLDEPLMKQFGSDRIVDLMKKMGMKEEEAIAHNMVTTAIRRAQEKISKKAGDIKTRSQEEWVKINLGS